MNNKKFNYYYQIYKECYQNRSLFNQIVKEKNSDYVFDLIVKVEYVKNKLKIKGE